jgi:hypothetical protein
MEQSTSWEANSRSASQGIPYILWNLDGSLLCVQQPATGPYSDSDESSPHPLNLFL